METIHFVPYKSQRSADRAICSVLERWLFLLVAKAVAIPVSMRVICAGLADHLYLCRNNSLMRLDY
ncbi:hypothetical protein [Paenibacillus sp. Z6-24]